jgi:hypothetical protein
MSDHRIDRRAFNTAWVYALLGGAAITVTGCGDGGSPAGPSGNPTPTAAPVTDKEGAISGNHGHTAVVTAAQLTAGGALELNIQGTSAHTHTVSLDAAEIASIRSGQRVAKTSSNNNSHTHTVTFN